MNMYLEHLEALQHCFYLKNASLQSSDQSCQTEFLNPDYNIINQMWKIVLNKGTDVDV